MKKMLAFAAAGLIGIAGCSTDEGDVILQDPGLEETTTPVIIEPVEPFEPVEPEVVEVDTAVIVEPAEPM